MQRLLFAEWNSLKFGTMAFLIAAIVMTIFEMAFADRAIKKSWRATLLDVQFFFFNLLLPPVIQFALIAFAAILMTRRPPAELSPLVFAGQLLSVLLVFDVWTYARHRTFHSKALWRVHSIHHSSEELNWTSGPRNHSAEVAVDVIGELLVFALAAFAGADRNVLLTAGMVIGAWNFFIHANLPWTFGPLRYIFASPAQHRWHHSDAPEACDKNFAVMFSFIDVLLGTFYMPKGKAAKTTGLYADEKKNHPRNFLGQLIYPFRRHAIVQSSKSGSYKSSRSSSLLDTRS